MKNIILKSIFPVLAGIFNVLFLLILVQFIIYKNLSFIADDTFFLRYFLPISIAIAITIQHFIVLPIWNRFKSNKILGGFRLIPFTALICLIGGGLFAYVFWERDLGYGELLAVFLTGLIAFSIYWVSNLLLLNYIDN
ncbi:MAG: hypothetical protein AB7S48_11725 [Bacteroidales bacterium]